MDLLEWNLAAPTPSPLGDHDVPLEGRHLQGRRIALMVCGGIAAMKAPLIARALRRQGASVVAFASDEALRYVAVESLEWATVGPVVTRLTWRAEHLSDGDAFDLYLVAPATYNTLNKCAAGIADGIVTSALASALGRLEQGRTRILMAPTMHGTMHNRILVESCRRLQGLGVGLIAPRDAYGKHNLPDEDVLALVVCRALSRSPLAGRAIEITGGHELAGSPQATASSPASPDHAFCLRPWSGRLGRLLAQEAALRGLKVTLIESQLEGPAPVWLRRIAVRAGEQLWTHLSPPSAEGHPLQLRTELPVTSGALTERAPGLFRVHYHPDSSRLDPTALLQTTGEVPRIEAFVRPPLAGSEEEAADRWEARLLVRAGAGAGTRVWEESSVAIRELRTGRTLAAAIFDQLEPLSSGSPPGAA